MDKNLNPQKRVKQNLDKVIFAKEKKYKKSRSQQVALAASIALLIGLSFFMINKNRNTASKLAEQELRDSINKVEIASVLQNLGSLESRSSGIIPGSYDEESEGYDSIAINTSFEL